MRTVDIRRESIEINTLLNQAREEALILRTADGVEFVLAAAEDFDEEAARTRDSEELVAFLEARARQAQTVPLHEVKRRLGIGP